jgi:esterase/lipase superfamily enzyme
MSIYIISNRKIEGGEFVNRSKEKDCECAKREFRVAKVTDIDLGKYIILPDHEDTYAKAIKEYKKKGRECLERLNGSAQMFIDIYDGMLSAKDGQSDCLFFIHGFANSFQDNLDHIKKLYDLYIAPSDSGIDHLVYVSWPSRGRRHRYGYDQEHATNTGAVLGGLYNKLYTFFQELFVIAREERCSNQIHLAAHSMGNQVLEHMLRAIDPKRLMGFLGEVLLLNSDVDFDVFEENDTFCKLEKLANRTHIYISKSDEVLSVLSSYTKNFKRRLGHKGPRNYNSLSDETFVIDTTNVGRGEDFMEKTFDHWGYIKRQDVINDIRLVLKEVDEDCFSARKAVQGKRNTYKLKTL